MSCNFSLSHQIKNPRRIRGLSRTFNSPLGESNPCPLAENQISWATRRRGRGRILPLALKFRSREIAVKLTKSQESADALGMGMPDPTTTALTADDFSSEDFYDSKR